MENVFQIVKQIDKQIKVLQDSITYSASLSKDEVKEKYGSVKTYEECFNMENGALDALKSLRKWIMVEIVNKP